ncbi:hypothetical protein CBR_g41267 [Chara braunii]|uniref:Integrase catalytic domain-containing protein n=1 Tax=Chara braunii TaxID=69332 RepID=A0A388LVK1_CHABU|nr:hypothetical protein CBR_g41267 [Chara braunii]|eukprot:GBG86273.1 hypothetical protein CBR_g41267 [Chara braunii]
MYEIIRRLEAKDKVNSAEFELVNGLLFLKKAGNKRLCVPNRESLSSLFLGECHDATVHFGYKKPATNLLQWFWWPTMMRDAQLYVETCQLCQRDKPRTQDPLGLLMPLPIPERPGDSLYMDFMDTLVTSKSGMRHIFVIVDRFSKYARLVAMPETTRTEYVIRMFKENWVRDFGLPKSIISDRDVRFTSELWKAAAAEQGTQLQMTSGNHPEANGQAEQLNRVVQHLLRHYIKPNQVDWDEKLALIASLYNNVVHSATGSGDERRLRAEVRARAYAAAGEVALAASQALAAANAAAREQAAAAASATAMATAAASSTASSFGTQLGMPHGPTSTSGSSVDPHRRELQELQQVERTRLERELKQATNRENEIRNRTAILDTLEADKAALEELDESAMSDAMKVPRSSILSLHAHVDSRLDFMQSSLDQILDLLQRLGLRPTSQSLLLLTAMSGPFPVQVGTQPSGTSAAAAHTVASTSSGLAAGATPQPQQSVPPQGQQQSPWYPKTPMKPPLAFSGEKKDEELNTWLRTVPMWVRAKRTMQEEEVITAASYLEGKAAKWLDGIVAKAGFGRRMADWGKTLTLEEFLDMVEDRWHNPLTRCSDWTSEGPRGEHFVVEVVVGGRKCGDFVDIGTTQNFISHNCLERLRLENQVQHLSRPVASTLANKECMVVTDYVKDVVCTFSYGGGELNHKISFLVSDDLPFDMLLVMYYLEVAKPQFDWDKKVLKHELLDGRTVKLTKYKANRLLESYGYLCASTFYNYYKQNQEEGMYLVYVSEKGEAVKTPPEIGHAVAKFPDMFEEPT